MARKKLFIISGEASGDLHGSNLIKALINLDADLQIEAWGGPLMEKAGARILKDYKELAFMGFLEVIQNLPKILSNFKLCKRQIEAFRPDLVVLIDYPGFNLRMAKWLYLKKIKVVYYISPQIWAWKENRIHQIQKFVSRMICILPFEKAFYKERGVDADYVGHPLLEVIDEYKSVNKHESGKQIALLPGSRKQEIKNMLPIMLDTVSMFPDYKCVIAMAPGQDAQIYEEIIQQINFLNADFTNQIELFRGQSYAVLNRSKAALVTSGTATLETGLFGVPQVVCYKGNSISYLIARSLIKVKYISLVNLILDKPFLRELIQKNLNPPNLKQALEHALSPANASWYSDHYATLRELLQTEESASSHAARLIYGELA
jgi:lipid-A-disaccharide synthase